LIVFAKAVVLSSVLSVMAVLFAFRFEGFSRTVFIIDGILMFMFLCRQSPGFSLVSGKSFRLPEAVKAGEF